MGAERPNDSRELVARHEAARRRVATLRIAGPLVLVAVVGFNVWGIVDQVRSLDVDELSREVEDRAASTLMPKMQRELELFAHRAQPAFERAALQAVKEFSPRLEKRLESEIAAFQRNMTVKVESAVETAARAHETERRAILVKYIPEVDGDTKAQDRILESVQAGATKWAMRQYTHTFHEHIRQLEKLRKTLDTYYADSGKAGSPLVEDTIGIWLELMAESVGGDDTILGQSAQVTQAASKKGGK